MKTIRELYEAFKFWFIIAVVVGILYCIISDSPYLKMQRGRVELYNDYHEKNHAVENGFRAK